MRPRVLHVMEAFAGGTERHLLDLVRHVEQFEHVIAVPTRHHGQSTARAAGIARAAGARVVFVEMGRSGVGALNIEPLVRLRGVIQECLPDIVHGHSSIAGVLARMAVLPSRVPLVYTPHAVSRTRWATAVERMLRGRTDRFIAVSSSERDFALRHGLVSPERVTVIPNGIDLTPPPPPPQPLRTMLRVPADAPLVGCVARLTWQKAPEVYVAAAGVIARHVPHAQFVLIGSGPLQRTVERAIRDARLSHRFHLIPSLPDAAAALPELDAFVLPSRFEGAPYTPLEAMRASVPVIVTDVDGNRDVVRPGVSGLVVPCDDPASLAGAVVSVIEDHRLRDRLVQAARDALPRFDVRRMAAATQSVYAELLGAPPAPAYAGAPRLKIPSPA